MRITTFVCVLLLLASSRIAFAQPATKATTDADLLGPMLKLNRAAMVDAYQASGQRDPKWDREATAVLEKLAVYTAESFVEPISDSKRTVSPGDLLELSDDAIDAGCQDPLIRYAAAIGLYHSDKHEKAAPIVAGALDAVLKSKYPAYCKFLISHFNDNANRYPSDVQLGKEQTRALLAEFMQTPVKDPIELRLRFRVFVRSVARWVSEHRAAAYELATAEKAVDPWLKSVLRGRIEVEYAFDARGGAWAANVKQEQWKGMGDHFKRATENLKEAWKLRPSFPEPCSQMARICGAGGGEEGDTMQLWFDRAVALQVDYIDAWTGASHFTRPRWGGSYEEMLALGKRAVETGRFDSQAPLYLLTIILPGMSSERDLARIRKPADRDWEVYTRMPVWPLLEKMFDGYIQSDAPGIDKQEFIQKKAILAYRCQEYTAFAEAFKGVKGKIPDEWIAEYNLDPREINLFGPAVASDHGEQVLVAFDAERVGDFGTAEQTWKKLIADCPPSHVARQYAMQRQQAFNATQSIANGKSQEIKFTQTMFETTPGPGNVTAAVLDTGELEMTFPSEREFVPGKSKYYDPFLKIETTADRRIEVELFFPRQGRKGRGATANIGLSKTDRHELFCHIMPHRGAVTIDNGPFVPTGNAKGSLKIPSDEWIKIKIEQRGGEIKVWMNGQNCLEKESFSFDPERYPPAIALGGQALDKGAMLRFRNLVITPLPPADARGK